MEEVNRGVCFNCGFESELIEAIDNQEVIRICRDCARKSGLPLIQKPTPEQLRAAQRFQGVKERLASAPGFRNEVHVEKKHIDVHAYDEALKKVSLSKPVKINEDGEDKQIEKVLRESLKKREYPDLVENFHWHIQQGRRMKKISQKQLGEFIAEPEVMISLAEQGKLPDNYDRLISKLEQYLSVKLRKESLSLTEEMISDSEETSEEDTEAGLGFMQATKNYFKSWKESILGNSEEEAGKEKNSSD